ncbi:phasin family protein [Arhodomonas sp. SL1]|uniref:phasin family protein n=1 Tax=Arhodomonas sp. SL1 TaxID=3425691 RepID=UPI003F8806CA
MTDFNFDQINSQFDKTVFAPARELAAMTLDHAEKLANLQVEAGKAYTEMTFSQLRGLINVRDQKGVQSYVENQQKLVQNVSDRVKGDAEKVVALQQEFAEKAQKTVQDSMSQAAANTQKAANSAKGAQAQ